MATLPKRLCAALAIAVTALGMSVSAAGAAKKAAPHHPVVRATLLRCSKVSAKQVSNYLKIKVTAPRASVAGSTSLCAYASKTSSLAVVVQITTTSTKSSFLKDRRNFDSHGEPTRTIVKLGDAAFSATLGSGQFHQNSVVALKGHTEVFIGSSAPIPRLSALVRSVLTLA